ncbi:MAG TPA: radical SAM protein [Spirochaetota bacterium]|nr:radical SAM protein [Spirochaetota bacterium]HOD15925.1 radical SAM protein [Spirochaetota bacterium]HPG50871.1 radical SAM protein [Spirochaetota bacterium]HPN11898.1 radical SAM protein [Spirochaetota bacterium]
MKKKVLLINPPYPMEESPSPPFGIMSLAAYLLDNGFDVRVEDYIVNPYSRERAASVVHDYRPDVIGSTGVTMNINTALRILEDYHEESPGCSILIGGPHVSFDAQNILSGNQFIDFVIRGEGELTTVELLENLGKPEKYGAIRGLSFRDGNEIIHGEWREFIQDINILPLPARHLIQLSKYKALGLPINMITSRGCPFECIFCVGSRMVGRRVRYFDTKRVVDEFEMLAGMGFRQINIVDDLFTSNKKRCTEICEEIISRGIKHPWTAFARVDTVTKELLDVMKASGCTTLCFGIESGNQEILDRVKKKTTLDKIEKAIRVCNEAGILPMASYIMGLPGESPDTVRETMEFARKLCNSYGFHILAPFPGTEVREKAEEYGMKILTSDWDQYDANRSVCESKYLPHEEVDRIVTEFNGLVNEMIIGILKKFDRGEKLSDENVEMAKSIISLDFNQRMMDLQIVESYAGHETNGKGYRPFIEFVALKSGLNEDLVKDEIDRLFNMGCLAINKNGNREMIAWT